jgi:death-on-curing family protein
VNSQKATDFRIWANKILKNYLVKGYAINERKFSEIQKIVQFITDKAKVKELSGHEKEILDVIDRYSKTWKVLSEYDKGKIEIEKPKKTKFQLNFYKCSEIIDQLKEELVAKGLADEYFGLERENTLEETLEDLYRTYSDKEDNSVEEKAAHILYAAIKDRPFTDGNKRIGSLLFLYFLEKNNFLFKAGGEVRITDRTLVALALLVASSDPKEKDTIIKLIVSLIQD